MICAIRRDLTALELTLANTKPKAKPPERCTTGAKRNEDNTLFYPQCICILLRRTIHCMVGYAMKNKPINYALMVTEVKGKHHGTLVYKGREYNIKEREHYRVIPGLHKMAGIK